MTEPAAPAPAAPPALPAYVRRFGHLAGLPVRVALAGGSPAVWRSLLPLAELRAAEEWAGESWDVFVEGRADLPHAERVAACEEALRRVVPGGVAVLEWAGEEAEDCGAWPGGPLVEPGASELVRLGPGKRVLFVQRARPASAWCADSYAAAIREPASVPAAALRPSWAPLLGKLAHPQARLVLVTPCSRPGNLAAMRALVRPHEARVAAWLVVHDAAEAPESARVGALGVERHLACRDAASTAGNAQRNLALGLVESTDAFDADYLYFLDDDNVVHPGLWDLPLQPGSRHLVCFDAFDLHGSHGLFRTMPRRVNPGSTPRVCRIDTAQVAVGVALWKDAGAPRWRTGEYCADGLFIEGLAARFPGQVRYVAEVLALSNYLRGPPPDSAQLA
jgi:hypothetical protein